MQSYLSSKALNNEEKELLFNLRSKCHSGIFFRKMNRNNINCVLECPSNEDQRHVFLHCRPVLKLVNHNSISSYEDIFGTLLLHIWVHFKWCSRFYSLLIAIHLYIFVVDKKKIPHTGDIESLDNCGS